VTHKQRVLDLLKDGRPHSHHELYGLGCVAHSRISDLRRYKLEAATFSSPAVSNSAPASNPALAAESTLSGRDGAGALHLFEGSW